MRSVPASTAAMRSASTSPEMRPVAASDTASCSSVSLKSIRLPFPAGVADGVPAGTNTGSDSSSSKSTKVACTGMPIRMARSSTPSRLATSRVPSSSSMRPMGSGYSKDGTCG